MNEQWAIAIVGCILTATLAAGFSAIGVMGWWMHNKLVRIGETQAGMKMEMSILGSNVSSLIESRINLHERDCQNFRGVGLRPRPPVIPNKEETTT